MIFLRSGDPKLEINIFHISYTIIYSPFLFHFYISCLDQPGIRETSNKNGTRTDFELHYVTPFVDFIVFESALGS